MSRMLAIETSAETCSVALDMHGEVREKFEHAPLQHAELILPAVSSLLAAAGIAVKDLDAIAFGRGPGSFTSLRIGIGVVQGLAWGADVPVVPVSSLAAVAQAAWDDRSRPAAPAQIVVAMDARMQEVFHATFRAGDNGIVLLAGEERVSAASAVQVKAPWLAAGNGFERFDELRDLAQGAVCKLSDTWPRASAVLKLAHDWLRDRQALPAGQAQPVYIRNDVAQKTVKT